MPAFYTTLTNADLTAADLRGAYFYTVGLTTTTTNTILSDGTINGLHLDSRHPTLSVRNYVPASGGAPVPIHILANMTTDPNTSLQFALDDNPWDSTISFASGIPITLGGDLELDLTAGVDPAGLVGDTFQLFDWTGVSPNGQFGNINNDLPSGYSWNTSQLYTTGNVTLVPEPSTLALLGVLGLLGYIWRRRQR